MRGKLKGVASFVDTIVELIDLIAEYARKQLKNVIDESIAKPLKSAGRKVALLLFAFSIFSLAAIFITVGLFLSLVHFVGYPISYLLIGVVLVVVGMIAVYQAGR
ncbi:MAG TPA: hypothetical protein VGK02_08745 [Candidatus Aquicultor sp.]|jgi:hypothetical protein